MRPPALFVLIAGLSWPATAHSQPLPESAGAGEATLPSGPNPTIQSIRLEETGVVVLVSVPAGVKKITLEACRKLGRGDWAPKAVARRDGAAGEVTFRLARSSELEMLRVRGDASDPLPSFFYQGTNSFAGQPGSPPTVAADGSRGGVLAFNAAGDASPGVTAAPVTGSPTAARAVAESDIWKVEGDTLYFFNQYRGLQVIDISQPDTPRVRGTLPLAAAGEQLYLLDSTHIVLLARQNCRGAESEVVVVEIAEGTPRIVASVPVNGYIKESRLVGTALYVASETYQKVEDPAGSNTPGGERWEWSTLLSAFDLSRPNDPVARPTQWISCNGGDFGITSCLGSVVTATDRFLFVAGGKIVTEPDGNWWRQVIHVIDIGAPDGTMIDRSTIQTIGRVPDKFKMHLAGDVLSVVSESSGPSTHVETFSLTDPSAPRKLGALKVIERETLFATRFDGQRLYAVTFRTIDPLWVIDLSDPVHPRIAGELQIPGWSTYIHPLGDRLVTIGVDNTARWRVAVSVFNVADAAHPSVLNRVFLGDQHSSSEATFDEKALGVFPEAGLVLVPFSSWSSNAPIQAVQLIDLGADGLTLRGTIAHEMSARRAAVHRDRILSLSGRELLSVDATDRDHPVVNSELELAWSVDRVFLQGEHLLEIDENGFNGSGPQVRVALADVPDQVFSRFVLTNLPLLGVSLRADKLYLAQGSSPQVNWQWVESEYVSKPVSTNSGVFKLTVLDLSRLPVLTLNAQTEFPTDIGLAGELEPLWPQPGLLVWYARGYSSYWGRGYGPYDPLLAVPVFTVATPQVFFAYAPGVLDLVGSPDGRGVCWPGFGSVTGRLTAFDVTDAAAPRVVSDIALGQGNRWSDYSSASVAEGMVYLSHREDESRITGTNYYTQTVPVTETLTNIVTITNYITLPQVLSVTNSGVRTDLLQIAIRNRLRAGEPAPDPEALGAILAVGGYHSLALDSSGAVWSWGANWFGQLGDGALSNRSQILATPIVGVTALAAGVGHSVALKADGSVWAWGADMFGQLGDGVPPTVGGLPPLPDFGRTTPARALELAEIGAIAAGSYHNLALRNDGRVWAWGLNSYGQLGDGVTDNLHTPKLVAELDRVVRVAGGGFHSLVVKADGTVWAWGRNNSGQLGNGTTTDAHKPEPVKDLAGAVAVAGGLSHSLALTADGTVWAWGRSEFEQTAGSAASTHPEPVAGLNDVVAIAAGASHDLALKADGTVWAWGENDFSQLGDGTTSARNRPSPVVGLNDAVAISAGGNVSLALTSGGTVWAFGRNDYGQLGDGVPFALTNDVPYIDIFNTTNYTTVTNYIVRTNYSSITRYVTVTNAVPSVAWWHHYYLDVVDYLDPSNPIVRDPVNLPGSLEGLSHRGALLYTRAWRSGADAGTGSTEWLDASAYDGVNAHLVDSLELPQQWPHPLVLQEATAFLGRAPRDTNSLPQLESWTVRDTGKFTQIGSAQLDAPAQSLLLFGDLLAVHSPDEIHLFNDSNPALLSPIGSKKLSNCLGFDLTDGDGTAERGLWVPFGFYGVEKVK